MFFLVDTAFPVSLHLRRLLSNRYVVLICFAFLCSPWVAEV